jgi:hypothetical protein
MDRAYWVRVFSGINHCGISDRSGNPPDGVVHLTACSTLHEPAEIKANLHQGSGRAIVQAEIVVFPAGGTYRRATDFLRPA